MRLTWVVFGFIVACGMVVSTANAAVVITFGPVPTFVTNTGIRSIDVFANSTLPGGQVGAVLGADFVLGNGAIFDSPNAGSFGGPGFIGNGNINPVASSFERDPNPVFSNVGYLNITFQNFAQTVTDTPTPLATLLVDTTGLAAGSYSVNVINGFFGAANIADVSSSFNVTAVPEPSSLALLGLASCGALVKYRKRLGKKAIAA